MAHPNEFTFARIKRHLKVIGVSAKVRPEDGGYVLSRGQCSPGAQNDAHNFMYKIEVDSDDRWYFCSANEFSEWQPLAVYRDLDESLAVIERFVQGELF